MADLPTRRARTLKGHAGPVLRVRYTRDGAYAMTCSADRTLRLWNPARDDETGRGTGGLLVKTYSGPHAHEVSDVAISDDKARFALPITVARSDGSKPLRASRNQPVTSVGRISGSWSLSSSSSESEFVSR